MAKIYLSPAAHAHDNSTKCPMPCGENVHANLYMDIVERRLKELGFEVKRGDKSLTGSVAMRTRVTEANRWKADLYYVAHTNAGGGRRSMTIHYPNAKSKSLAEVMHKYRKAANNGNHRVVARNDLYEINATSMPCLYDELFFHDNAEDCAWFHNGGMELMAEEACKAFCEIFGVAYKPHGEDDKKLHYYVQTNCVWLARDEVGVVGQPITGIAIDGDVHYRVHVRGGNWLGWIEKCDLNDYYKGYAGNGMPIDAVQIRGNNGVVTYRVSPLKKGYYPWQDNTEVKRGMDGYAGSFGKQIDRLEVKEK